MNIRIWGGMLLMLAPLTGQADMPADLTAKAPKITKVTVFEDRAQVVRAGHFAVKAGKNRLVFTGFPVTLMDQTLRAKITGGKLLSIKPQFEVHKEVQKEAVKKLTDAITQIRRALSDLAKDQEILTIKSRKLDQYRNYAAKAIAEGSTGKEMPEWGKTLRFLEKQSMQVAKDKQALRLKDRAFREDLKQKEAKLHQLRYPHHNQSKTAVVNVEAPAAGEAQIELRYQVRNCSWHPEYDVRYAPGTKNTEVTYFGSVRQHSGEDWTGVALTLSTARPGQSASAPKLYASRISAREVNDDPVQVGSEMEKAQRAPQSAPAPSNQAGQGGGDSVATVEDRGHSVVFNIQEKATIAANGDAHKVQIVQSKVSGESGYEAVPKLLPFVYEKVTLKNETPYPFLPGPMHVHKQSGFMGTGYMKYRAAGEPFHLSVGVDEDIKVKRTRVTHPVEGGTDISKERIFDVEWTLEVQNFKGVPVSVSLKDHMPVSQLKDKVEVELDTEHTTRGFTRTQDGLITWPVELQAKDGKQVITLRYKVTVAENVNISF